jgi:AcrR family transcriptional regulator
LANTPPCRVERQPSLEEHRLSPNDSLFSPRTKEATRETLLTAAADEFDRVGLERANVDAIALRPGYANGTVYNYWRAGPSGGVSTRPRGRGRWIVRRSVSVLAATTETVPGVQVHVPHRSATISPRLMSVDAMRRIGTGPMWPAKLEWAKLDRQPGVSAVASSTGGKLPGLGWEPRRIRAEANMDLKEALEQLSNATRSLKLSVSWLESQSDEQIGEISSGDWTALISASHDLEERAIELDREINRGQEAGGLG